MSTVFPLPRVWFAIVFVGMLAGCGARDPLQSFQPIAQACSKNIGAVRARHVWQSKADQQWHVTLYAPYVVSYDVKKTNSLVTPVVASIDITFDDATFKANDEAQAQEISVDSGAPVTVTTKQRYQFDYAYQEGKWVSQTLRHSMQITSIKDMPAPDVKLSHEQLRTQFPQASGCLVAAT